MNARSAEQEYKTTHSEKGVVEIPGHGSERAPLVLHGHRIDLTLSSRLRRRIEGRSLSMRPGSPSIRRANAPTRDEGGMSSRVKRE